MQALKNFDPFSSTLKKNGVARPHPKSPEGARHTSPGQRPGAQTEKKYSPERA
jgi:hypothetical protein